MKDERSVEYWREKRFHPETAAYNRLDEGPVWRVGDKPVIVRTKSGSEYAVASDGSMVGGRRMLKAKLGGSVMPGSSLIRSGCICLDMCMEFSDDEKTYISSYVEEVR